MYDGKYCVAATKGKGRGLIIPQEEEPQEEGEVLKYNNNLCATLIDVPAQAANTNLPLRMIKSQT